MVLHQAYFDVLASEQSGSPEWGAALAGLTVMRLVDAARLDSSVIDLDWTGLRAVSENIASLREGTPFRRPLTKVVDELRNPSSNWLTIDNSLLMYGRVLDLHGHWSLAADVFETVAEIARAERAPELAMEATIALGGAARRTGDWDRSAHGYAEAAYLADTLDDKASGLTVRIGTANTQIARGNLPAAQSILDEVITEASNSGLEGVEALALHASASVSHLRGNYDETVRLAYKALEKTENPSVKDSLMADIAAAFAELGMLGAARDAHMVVSLTSRYQWVRWQASINLMELSAMERMQKPFEDYAASLRNAALDPRLRSYFLLYYGQGLVGFGHSKEGRRYLTEARDFASQNKINQVVFEAEKALNAPVTKPTQPKKQWVEAISPDLKYVTAGLEKLKENALLSAPTPEWT